MNTRRAENHTVKSTLLYVVVASGLLLVCSRGDSSKTSLNDSTNTEGHADIEVSTSPVLNSAVDSLSRIIRTCDSMASANDSFARIEIPAIDSFISRYGKGDTMRITQYGTNECIGEELREVEFRNHLVVRGSTYNDYAMTWYFTRADSVMNLVNRMSRRILKISLAVPIRNVTLP